MSRGTPRKRGRPATTPEGRENQLISLASDLAEKQLANGTASAQVITHFLKLGSTRERLEQERLQRENLLLSAKVDQLASSKRIEELYEQALGAMKTYTGQDVGGYEEDDYYED
jgi:hypothetical protein